MSEGTTPPGGADPQLRLVARSGLVNLSGAVAGAVGLVLVIARQLNQSQAGVFFALTSAFLVLTALSSLGTEAGLGRFLLRFEVLGRREDIGAALRVTFIPVFITTTAAAIVVFLLAVPLARVMGLPVTQAASALRVLAVAAPVASLGNLTFASTRAFGLMSPTVLFDKVLRSSSQPVLVWVATTRTHRLDILAGVWAAPYLLSLVAGLVTLAASLRQRGLRPQWHGSARTSRVRREFWAFTWARGITQVAQLVIQRADIILIAALRGPSEAAIYTAATRFVPLGQMITLSFQQVLQPRFTVIIAREDRRGLRELFHTGTTWNLVVAWPLYAVVGSAPGLYLSIFGAAYGSHGVAVVVIMAIAMMLTVASGPLDTVILMLGRSTTSLGNALVGVGLDIGLCFLLIPRYGNTGAAFAWLVSRVAIAWLGVYQVRRLTGATPLTRRSLQVALMTLILVVFPVTMGTVAGLGTLPLMGVCAAAAAAYLGACYVLRVPLQLHLAGPAPRQRVEP
ncbi:MAG: polysaccharide biosynthesis C-terminal domain-containing protein [Actinomycetota bacterium]|nr:polysaccharide biosynthesis C-terminal domain-containing protein [Actinomycetota bacterium]